MTTDRSTIISAACDLDPQFYAPPTPGEPGRFEGAHDPELAYAIDLLATCGVADEIGEHVARVGRYVIAVDSQGFVALHECGDEAEASEFVAGIDRAVPEGF